MMIQPVESLRLCEARAAIARVLGSVLVAPGALFTPGAVVPRPPVAPMPPVGPVLPAGGAAAPPTAPGELLGARVPSEGTYVVVGVVGVAAPVDLPASVVGLGVAAPVDLPASVVGVGLVGAACDVSPGRVEVVEAALRSALARPASVVAVEIGRASCRERV